MGLVYSAIHLPHKKSTIHVSKHTSPMEPMSDGLLENSHQELVP